jgi:hypothetical protein
MNYSVMGLRRRHEQAPCGVCGRVATLTKAHVPPRAAGNDEHVARNFIVANGDSGSRPGRASEGGLWVYGLCAECNSDAGGLYDEAYADFASRIAESLAVSQKIILGPVPAVTFAPGRVTRAVLHGMHAISPHLRELYPTMATQLHRGGPVVLPGGLSLRMAGHLGQDALLVGPMLTAQVLGPKQQANTLASFTFRPFSWALVPTDDSDYFDARGWLNVTSWLRYEDDRTSHDLRFLADAFPLDPRVVHQFGSNDAMQLFSAEITPFVQGRLTE